MKKSVVIPGQQFGLWTVIQEAPREHFIHRRMLCRCECGNTSTVQLSHLRSGASSCCGCIVPNSKFRAGMRFNLWTLVRKERKPVTRVHGWVCKCACGSEKWLSGSTFKTTLSCGCVAAPRNVIHGMTRSPEWHAWTGMRRRCLTNGRDAHLYAMRGITICDRWQQFEHLFQDMGPKPGPRHTLDRIDNNGNYEPSNCRWVLPKVQANNQRRSIRILTGQDRFTVQEYAALSGLTNWQVYKRAYKGELTFVRLGDSL